MARNQRASNPAPRYQPRESSPEPIAPAVRRGIEIAQLPVGEWKAAIADSDPGDREAIRGYLLGVHAVMKQHADADRALDSGQDVMIEIRDSGKAA